MCKGQLIIKHQDGDCVFQISAVEVEYFETGLDLTVTCHKNRYCVLGFLPAPKLYLENINISKNMFSESKEHKIEIPFGWENDAGEEKEDNISRIYIGQHQPLNENIISLEKINSNSYKLSWSSEAPDFNYYDERARNNKLELNCEFRNV